MKLFHYDQDRKLGLQERQGRLPGLGESEWRGILPVSASTPHQPINPEH
jgi:hypothetical protein